jgi:hypothetical protein
MDSRDFSGTSYLVDFWKKRAGSWQIIARYGTRMDSGTSRPPLQLPPPTDIDSQLTERLRQREQQLGEAAMHMDTKVLEPLVGAAYTLRTGDAPEQSVPRALWMESLRPQGSHPYKLKSLNEQYHAARKLTDNLAIVSLLLTTAVPEPGLQKENHFHEETLSLSVNACDSRHDLFRFPHAENSHRGSEWQRLGSRRADTESNATLIDRGAVAEEIRSRSGLWCRERVKASELPNGANISARYLAS